MVLLCSIQIHQIQSISTNDLNCFSNIEIYFFQMRPMLNPCDGIRTENYLQTVRTKGVSFHKGIPCGQMGLWKSLQSNLRTLENTYVKLSVQSHGDLSSKLMRSKYYVSFILTNLILRSAHIFNHSILTYAVVILLYIYLQSNCGRQSGNVDISSF